MMEKVMSDRKLRQDVLDEMDFEPSVNALHIGVAVDKGVVTLSGHVASYAEKLAAERAVRRVKGVRAIAQEIEVRYPFDKKTADDEIARRALDILNWSAVVPRDAVQLTVHDGWITLNGQVDWQFQRSSAEDDIRKLSGVSGITNKIAIRSQVQPADVKRKIEDALRRNAEIEAQGITVTVMDGGKIALQGSVHDWHERTAAERAAWSAAGVVSVDDRLTIA
jgi:osmotically-inducible protein OsmY